MEDNVILSNGTHQFRRTVLMVSIDGLRSDYLDRGITPHLLEISQKGLRAKSMKPIFPVSATPCLARHFMLRTGLYAESHGIVANNFWDPVTDSQFHYSDSHIARQPHWWRGEPIWETAWKAGLTTANLMWLGPWTTSSGVQSTYFVPWKNKVPLQEKHDQIMKWIDLPFETRPQLILAYEPHVDQVGHTYGPDHPIVNAALRDVDEFAKSVHSSLQARNLSSIVDIIFVSDHGMTDTSDTRLVYMDDIMGRDHTDQIEHEDGWPSVGLRMSSGANMTDVIHRLETSAPATANPPQLYVYTEENMPERYHFSPKNNERIAPLYIVPRIGWALTTQHEHKVEMKGSYTPRGNHGYDNEEQSMHAMFVADGPFATTLKKRQLEREEAELFVRRNGPNPDRRKEPQVIPTFNNVELYSLVVKLLGMEKYAAPTNGTAGFWDRYLDEGASVEQDLE
ncbi:Phosphodiest-domain-containing protein [Clavulina sp. PMI_390]|nr:Phosphodiest-domain-containing protein [Clavulina sp. PMI_390]